MSSMRMNYDILDQQILHGIMILLMKKAGTMVLPQNGVIRFCIWDRDHGMDTQDLEFKFFAKRVETSYVVTATYV